MVGAAGFAARPEPGFFDRSERSRLLHFEVLPPPWTSAALESMMTYEGSSKGISTSSLWIVLRTRTMPVSTRSIPWEWSLPRHEHDVVNVVRYAAENQVAVHPRGAGTDTGGGAWARAGD